VLEYVPAGHGTHALALLAPAAIEYAPAGHDIQTLAPAAAEYAPAEQFVHALAPVSEYPPAEQFMQTLALLAPETPEYLPVPQSVHVALPLVVLYFPATQPVHGPPSGPVKPALQICGIQALTSELPLGEVLPAGHVAQFPSPFMHPVTFTSAICKVLYGPGNEI
jgi:hypothetical protein